MTLSDISEIAGVLSAAGVAVSVIYLALQVRQAERSQRALMQQGRATRASEAAFTLAQADLANLYYKGARTPKELTGEELNRFMLLTRAALLSAEDSVLHYRDGLLSPTAYRAFVAGVNALVGRSAGLRAAWRLTRGSYGPELGALMDDALAHAKPETAADAQAAWLAACEE